MGKSGHWTIKARQPRGKVGDFRRLDDPEALAPFLEDAAHYPGGSTPQVCFPSNEAETAEILARVKSQSASAVVIGAQSSLTGGATPKGDVVISTARMAELVSASSDRVVAQPGLVLHALLERLDEAGAYYPAVPTYDGATVGGVVATNAAGAATFKYGTTRDWVEGLTVVLASGDVLDVRRGEVFAHEDGYFEIESTEGARTKVVVPAIVMPNVPKKSAGYFAEPGMDLIDLFVGAEGTLGVVTNVELRILERRPAGIVGLVPMADEAALFRLVAELRNVSLETRSSSDERGIDVAAIEYMDARSLQLLEEDRACEKLGLTLPPDSTAILIFQADLPDGTGVSQAHEQIAAFGDATQDTAITRLCSALDRHAVFEKTIPALPDEGAKRDAVFALREAVPESVNRRVGEIQRRVDASISKSAGDVIVPFERFAESVDGYRSAANRHGLDLVIWGHASDGNVHPNVIARSEDEMRRARQLQLDIGQQAIDLGGCPMSEHGVGRNPVKKEVLRRLYGDAGVESMRAVKLALDPNGILSPGVVFDA